MKLNETDHRALALWAADCAERTIGYFDRKIPSDDRPRLAIEVSRAWARGEITVGKTRSASVAAHAAARGAKNDSAKAAARSAGHAAATAHMFQHARHAANYAIKAISESGENAKNATKAGLELKWQFEHLPVHLRPIVFPEFESPENEEDFD